MIQLATIFAAAASLATAAPTPVSPVVITAPPVERPIGPAGPDIQPPVRFRGDAPVPVAFVNPRLPNLLCSDGHPPTDGVILACTEGRGGMMILPNPCDIVALFPDDFYAALVCHELGHENGWDGVHTGGVPIEAPKP